MVGGRSIGGSRPASRRPARESSRSTKLTRRIAGAEGTASRVVAVAADACGPAHADVQQLMPCCAAHGLTAGPWPGARDDLHAQADDARAEASKATAVISAQTMRVRHRSIDPVYNERPFAEDSHKKTRIAKVKVR
jgi:hypothetical protein